MEKLRQQIEQRLSAVTGDACFYYENLCLLDGIQCQYRRVRNRAATRLTSP